MAKKITPQDPTTETTTDEENEDSKEASRKTASTRYGGRKTASFKKPPGTPSAPSR